MTYPGGFDAIDLRGTDITTEITSGQLGALIKLRDTTLPNLQSELNTLASGVFDQINAVHNDGTAFPPPNTLTGTQTVAAGDPFAGTGTTRIAVVDANGDLVAPPIELDLTAYATVGAVQTALNAALGANGTASIVGGNLGDRCDQRDPWHRRQREQHEHRRGAGSPTISGSTTSSPATRPPTCRATSRCARTSRHRRR